jgi:hypothetical protein
VVRLLPTARHDSQEQCWARWSESTASRWNDAESCAGMRSLPPTTPPAEAALDRLTRVRPGANSMPPLCETL